VRSIRVTLPLLVAALAGAGAVACKGRSSDAPAVSATTGAGSGEVPSGVAPGEGQLFPKQQGFAPVDLAGASHPVPTEGKGEEMVYATALETRVFARPDTKSPKIGYLKAGAAVEASPKKIGGEGCAGGFRAIRPVGYVCLGPEATTDPNHPVVKASFRRPDPTQKLPYIYGMAQRGGPAYARLPTADDVKTFEPHYAQHIKHWGRDKDSGARYGQDLWLKWKASKDAPDALQMLADKTTDPDVPAFLANGARVPNLSGFVPNGAVIKAGEFSRHNGVAFIDTFLWEGRRMGLSTDLRLFPTDRFRPIRGSDYHGVVIGKEVELPFGIVRARGQKRFKPTGGKLAPAGPLEWRSVVKLTGKVRSWGGSHYFETTDEELVPVDAVSKIEIAKKMPGWAVAGEKWIDINVTKQLLVAYEGEKPVYATLVSTGEAGLDDPATTKSTKRGIFRIHTKYLTATMDSKTVGEEFELRDVPYVQYFQDGYALHAAYWHDVFGQPKSHGCINLAPEDARRIFFWTEPAVPVGWHGAAKALTGTVVFIHQ
jgi:hypothetical protein